MMIFHKNLRKIAEIIKNFVAKILKICLKKMYTLNRYGGNSYWQYTGGRAAGCADGGAAQQLAAQLASQEAAERTTLWRAPQIGANKNRTTLWRHRENRRQYSRERADLTLSLL